MSRTKYLWLYVNPDNPPDAYDCVEELCMMVISINGNQEFTVSFDPNIQLLVENNQVNLMQDGQGHQWPTIIFTETRTYLQSSTETASSIGSG